MIGFLILVIAGFLTGPSKILHLPETSATLMLIGLYLLGTGVACTIVPVIPEMLAATGQNEKANDKVSAIFNIFGGFGQIFSPPMAGFLNDTLGFNYSLDACALSVICFLTVYFVWCDGYGAMIKSFSGSVKNVDKVNALLIKTYYFRLKVQMELS